MKEIFRRIIFVAVLLPCVKTLSIKRDASISPSTNSTVAALDNSATSNNELANGTNGGTPYWLENIKHQGTAAFRSDPGYQVFRNVKDFGAKGDGVSDDTLALNLAISSGNRCGPGSCDESTTSPGLVYIPGGTYLVSAPIIDFYMTQIIGNPNDRPILKATDNFKGFALIEGNPYRPGNAANPAGSLSYGATNVFYRQIRNLILDTTAVSASSSIKAIHWPTAQATSLQNLSIRMNDQSGTQHQGLFVESGSGGFMSDLEFHGGLTGAVMGSQQFTTRNLRFYNAVEAIEQVWDWGWTYKSLHVGNCTVGLNMTNVNPAAQNVGSIVLLDSFFANTPTGIATSHDSKHWSVSNGSLILENVGFENVQLAVQGTQGWTALPTNSGNLHVQAWGIGHQYAEQGPQDFLGTLPAVSRIASLTAGSDNGSYYERSKPDYRDVPVSDFLSVKTMGAEGDGVTDDTEALQAVLDQAGSNEDHVAFFDAGTYRVTKTLRVPKVCRIVGESYATIMSSGHFFANMTDPQAVVQVGSPSDVGKVEWSDMIVSTQGSQAGAILIEWNVASTGQPSGMWDVHTRIGGFAGSKSSVAECGASLPSSVGSSSGNNTINRREAALGPKFNVGFPVYEGVATPTYLASLGSSAPQLSFTASQDLLQPSSAVSPDTLMSDSPVASVDAAPTIDSAPSSYLPPQVTLAPLPSLAPIATPLATADLGSVASLTSLSVSTPIVDATASASPALLTPSSPSPDLSSPYNLTSQQPLDDSSLPTNLTSNVSSIPSEACIGAFMSMHITKSASGLYMENVWLWTADHDLDAPLQNITVWSGRGLLIESEKGDVWMVGTASEHHLLYQYQLAHTQNIVLGQMQSESAYYQSDSRNDTLFSPVEALHDPNAADSCKSGSGRCDGYGLRILESQHVAVYGAGLYSFFDDYNEACAFHKDGTSCQQSIFSIESGCTDITVYNLNTVGAASMVDKDGTSIAKYSDNVDVFPDTIALFRLW